MTTPIAENINTFFLSENKLNLFYNLLYEKQTSVQNVYLASHELKKKFKRDNIPKQHLFLYLQARERAKNGELIRK